MANVFQLKQNRVKRESHRKSLDNCWNKDVVKKLKNHLYEFLTLEAKNQGVNINTKRCYLSTKKTFKKASLCLFDY